MLDVFFERNLILLISFIFFIIVLTSCLILRKGKLYYILIIVILFIISFLLYNSYQDILIKESVISSDVYIYDIELINSNLNLYNVTIDDLYDDNDNKIILSIFSDDGIFLKENNKYSIKYNKYTKKLLNYTY